MPETSIFIIGQNAFIENLDGPLDSRLFVSGSHDHAKGSPSERRRVYLVYLGDVLGLMTGIDAAVLLVLDEGTVLLHMTWRGGDESGRLAAVGVAHLDNYSGKTLGFNNTTIIIKFYCSCMSVANRIRQCVTMKKLLMLFLLLLGIAGALGVFLPNQT